jgi:hypothetical protein
VAAVLRLSDVAAAEVAVAISHVLLPLGHFLEAAEDVAAREILRGLTEIFPRHAEVLGGTTMVVAVVMAMVVMVAMMVMVVVIEQIIQETSNETSRETWEQTEHSAFSIVARGACACLMPTLRCLLTV